MTFSTLALVSLLFVTWRPEYAQLYTKEQLDWFSGVIVPNGTGKDHCCSRADGDEVLEEIRGDEYWIMCSLESKCPFKTWTRVPANTVVTEPNMLGRPVVWWYMDDEDGEDFTPHVRCYAPGAGG